MVFNTSMYMQNAQIRQQSDQALANAIQGSVQMFQQQQMQKRANLDKKREQAQMQQQASLSPEAVLAKAQQYGVESLTPEEIASFEAFQKMQGSKVAVNSLTNEAYSPYKRISLGEEPQTNGSPIADVLLPPPVTEEKYIPSPSGRADENVNKNIMGASSRMMTSPAVDMERAKTNIELQKEQKKAEFEKNKQAPIVERAVVNAISGLDDILKVAEKSYDKADDWFASGASGAFARKFTNATGVPTPASDLDANLETLKAKSFLENLMDLKKLGGGIGSASEVEGNRLAAIWGNVESSQSPEQLQENLAMYQRALKRSSSNIAETYKAEFGRYPKGYKPQNNSSEGLPSGAEKIGTQNGKDVYQTPDGKMFVAE